MNRISSYASPLDLYRQVSARQEAAPARSPAPQQSASLSSAEQQQIQQQFPASPALSMRLYGPGAGAHTVAPGALGSRLDLQG